MNFQALKQVVVKGNPEVHILSNQGDLYLVQIFHDGGQTLLTQKNSSRPLVFHGLPECYEKLADAGLHAAYVNPPCTEDEMINLDQHLERQADHRMVTF